VNAPLFKGKRLADLSHAEAIECALHFYSAHLESFQRAAAAERRMNAMAERFTEEQIRRLDRWLEDHVHNEVCKGDGTPLWPRWWNYGEGG
jgi:hypothetical protein